MEASDGALDATLDAAPPDVLLADAPADMPPDHSWPSVDALPDVQDPRCRPAWSACTVPPGEIDAPTQCADRIAPTVIEPEIQWTWTSPTEPYSLVTPLVANLTDDNGDGRVDLCDTPDIIVVAYAIDGGILEGHVYILDGATGRVHFVFESAVNPVTTPAVGDIDSDGWPEVVTMTPWYGPQQDRLIAFEHDGTVHWIGETETNGTWMAIALADLDNDGDVEILARNIVADHLGGTLWTIPELELPGTSTTMAADLDGDGDLEVIFGRSAYHQNGTLYWRRDEIFNSSTMLVHVANFDLDPAPEVLLVTRSGQWLLEHDGQRAWGPLNEGFKSPAAVHDHDGDGLVEFGVASRREYALFRDDGAWAWSAVTDDSSSNAGGTAFDLLGDGSVEPMYADQWSFFIYDPDGEVLYTIPRFSGTCIEYPVVADVDNDGSAEIVVVSSHNVADNPDERTPTVQVLRDKRECWVQARRIWNQHTYHVTNVREDGTIPQYEPPSWERVNTFRANAPVTCEP